MSLAWAAPSGPAVAGMGHGVLTSQLPPAKLPPTTAHSPCSTLPAATLPAGCAGGTSGFAQEPGWGWSRHASAGLSGAAACLLCAARRRRRCSAPNGSAVKLREARTDKVETKKAGPSAEWPPAAWHRYADPKDWCDAWSTVEEFGPQDVTVEGTIPEELLGGTFYRAGPGLFERGGKRYRHVIDGDGYVYSFTLGKESARVVGRFVETEEFLEENENDKIMHRSTFGTQPGGADAWSNVLNLRLKNLANTTVCSWGKGHHQRLLALYEAGLPMRLDPESLETQGVETFGDELRPGAAVTMGFGSALDSSMGFGHSHTAHPHIDVRSNSLASWWYHADVVTDKILAFFREWDDCWRPKHTTRVRLESSTAPHDFCMTPSYYIMCANRMVLTPAAKAKYLLGMIGPAEGIGLEAEEPNIFHIVRRGVEGEAIPLLVETPPWFCIHHSHANEELQEDGTRLVTVYSAGWSEKGLESGTFLGAWGGHAPEFSVIPVTYYFKTVISVAADESSAELVSHGKFPGMETTCMDHPHVDPRTEARLLNDPQPTKPYCYMNISNREDISSPTVGWQRLDLESGETATWMFPPMSGQFGEELVIVPKAAGEGSWVLGTMSDIKRQQTCLCIIDGDRFEEGPVARVWLPAQMSHPLHGCFVPKGH